MRILFASSIDSESIKLLKKKHDVICAFNAEESQLISLIKDRDIVVFRSGVQITSKILEHAKHLKLLIRAGSGLDNLDCEYVKTHNIRLDRIPEPGSRAVAELAFALMLALSRQLLQVDILLRKGHWAKNELKGFLLKGKTLGIIGVGNIGLNSAQLGKLWGMKVIGCVKNYSTSKIMTMRSQGIKLLQFEDVLKRADYVLVHVPLNESTKNMIQSEQLALMKSGSYLVNLARGGIVDENALYQELSTHGRIAGAALDVHLREGEGKISPLAKLDNVILTPHIGATTVDTQREIGKRVIKIIESY